MRYLLKTAFVLFLFILVLPLYAQSSSDEEFTLDDWLRYYYEELYNFDDGFETHVEEENSFTEEISINDEIDEEIEEDIFFAYESFPDDDSFFFESPPLIFEVPAFEMRSFDDIFPNITRRQRSSVMSINGLRYYFTKDELPRIVPNPDLEIDLLSMVMNRDPSHIIEALVLVPYNEKEFDLLDVYNALGRIEYLKDYPVSVNGNDYYVFTESTRIESSSNRRAIPDPLPAVTLPFSETIYLRLRESSFGNLFIRGEISVSRHGITYDMTNFADVRYFLLPVMRAERFSTIIYLEPVKEGVLIYSMSGFYLPNFVADRVNLTANINRRIDVFVNWITDGLRRQENPHQEVYFLGQEVLDTL